MAGTAAREVKFLSMPHDPRGRRIAYVEKGCLDGTARRSLLAIHGLMSCRLSTIPGVKEETLQEYGVRLVSIDRPGYGQSDKLRKLTFRGMVKDIEAVMDGLELGEKVWLLGFSMGGAFCWAAARFIPHRIAGIALWSPVCNLYWKGISKRDRSSILSSYTRLERTLTKLARCLPFAAYQWYAKRLSSKFSKGPTPSKWGLSEVDWQCLQKPGVAEQMIGAYDEALKHHKGYGVAKDVQLLMSKNWGFDIKEIDQELKQVKVHIWQGDKDKMVPFRVQQYIQKILPNTVVLHELPGEGHISWVFFNDSAHRTTLSTLFQDEEAMISPP